MLKAKNIDITGGPIFKSIVLYAIPVIIGSLIQVLFNSADLMVLKQMAGDGAENATASVGATAAIVSLVVNSFVGLAAGSSVAFARAYGARDGEKTKIIVNTSIISSFFIGIFVATLLIATCNPFLVLTRCPEECMYSAAKYLMIYALSVPAVMVYNFGSAIVRTAGDTQRPLYYLIAAGAFNVVLNFILCLVLDDKVAAVAIATAVSQLLSAALVMIRLATMEKDCRFSLKELSFSFSELWKMLKIGIPAAVNGALFAISNMQVQSEINAFGQSATAAYAAAGSIDGVCASIAGGFSAATLPFVGQNFGAGKPDRVKKSILWSAVLACSAAVVMSTVLYTFKYPLLSLFLSEAEATEYAVKAMTYILLPYFVVYLYNIFVAAMQAFGYSLVPMLNSVICVLGFRFVWISFLYPIFNAQSRDIANLFVCYPISWTLCLIAQSIAFSIIYSKYKKEASQSKSEV